MTDDKSKLMSAQTAAAATDAIAKLVDQAGLGEKAPAASGKVVVDIEEMTRDLMRPIIKEWLDKNLPGLIEKIVQKEIERLARQAQDR